MIHGERESGDRRSPLGHWCPPICASRYLEKTCVNCTDFYYLILKEYFFQAPQKTHSEVLANRLVGWPNGQTFELKDSWQVRIAQLRPWKGRPSAILVSVLFSLQ